jgi:hypothetical protein
MKKRARASYVFSAQRRRFIASLGHRLRNLDRGARQALKVRFKPADSANFKHIRIATVR